MKKTASLLMVVLMAFTFMPWSVFAEDNEAVTENSKPAIVEIEEESEVTEEKEKTKAKQKTTAQRQRPSHARETLLISKK